MGKANYLATTSLVSITSETCGTDLLKRLSNTISPKSVDTTKQAKNKYTTHKDSFHDDTDFVTRWTTLLLLQTTKASLGIKEATHMDALDNTCEIIEEKTGCSSRWSMEIMAWKMKCKSGAQPCDLADPDDIDAVNAANAVKITSFEYHMRLHQQGRDTSGAKKEKSNAVNLKNPDYCVWCFKNTGKKWNNHSEATCKNKKRTEGGGGGGGGGKSRVCYDCQSTEHIAKDCLLFAKVRAMMATESHNVAENTNPAGVGVQRIHSFVRTIKRHHHHLREIK
jgi:hypothetical protein